MSESPRPSPPMRLSHCAIPAAVVLSLLTLGACRNRASLPSPRPAPQDTTPRLTVHVNGLMTTVELTQAIETASKGLLPTDGCFLVLGHTSSEGKPLLVEIDGAGEKLRGVIVCDSALVPVAHDSAMITAKRGVLIGSHPAESGDEVPLGNLEYLPPHEASDLGDTFMVLWVDPKPPEVFGAVQLLQWFHRVHGAKRLDYMQLPLQ